jgi:hypothetical protein
MDSALAITYPAATRGACTHPGRGWRLTAQDTHSNAHLNELTDLLGSDRSARGRYSPLDQSHTRVRSLRSTRSSRRSHHRIARSADSRQARTSLLHPRSSGRLVRLATARRFPLSPESGSSQSTPGVVHATTRAGTSLAGRAMLLRIARRCVGTRRSSSPLLDDDGAVVSDDGRGR